MKKGICPKCGAAEIYSGEDVVMKSGPFASNSVPISLTSVAALDNYVCGKCGLVESYIADRSKLKEIAKQWEKVEPEDASQSK